MPNFTKKAVTIEARRFETNNFTPHMDGLVAWMGDVARHDGTCIFIDTLEGVHRAQVGDWIIRGIQGEFYPCKSDIFDATYDAAPAASSEVRGTAAARDVLAERRRQIEVEGWTAEREDDHRSGELARAAASYATGGGLFKISTTQIPLQVWPYRWEWNPTNPRRDLVKAGALILAEIERLDRAAIAAAKEPTR